MVYSDSQIKDYANQLQSKGATPQEIEQFVSSAKASQTSTGGSGYQPGMAESAAGAVLGGAGALGGAIVNSTADDFKGLYHLPGSIFDPSHPDLAKNVAGSIGALTDVGIIAAGILGTPFTGGASDAAAAEALAAKSTAEVGVKKVAQVVAQKATGTVGLSAANAGQAYAGAKSKGASDMQALGAGAAAGGETLLTLGLMNKFGPKVWNAFTSKIGGSKIAEYAAGQFQKGVDILKNASMSQTMGETAHAVTSAVNDAATSVGRGVYSLFSKVATSLPEPGENTVGTMADSAFQNVNNASKAIDTQYGAVTAKLAGYEIPQTVAKTLEDAVGSIVPPTAADTAKLVDAEVTRMVSAGETAGMTEADITKAAKAAVDATARAGAQAEQTVTEAAQGLVTALKSGAKVTADAAYAVVNQVPAEVKDSVVVDRIQQAIKEALGKTPEGQALWDELRALSNRRAENQTQRGFAQSLATAKGDGWRSAVDAIFSKLGNAGDVQSLMKALGMSSRQFQDMLTKRVMESVSMAYRGVLNSAENGVVTPKVVDDAQKAATAALDKYLAKIPQLPGLLAPEREQLLYSMKNIIPNMETIAKNAGVNMTFAEGKISLGLAADKETLDAVTKTDWYKAISDPTKFTEAPAAIFNATVPEIQAIKKVLGADSEEWKAVGASALSHIWDTVKGLWGATDTKTIEGSLKSISSKVGGNEELFSELFDTTTKGGKKIKGGQILDDIVNYGNAIKGGLSKKGQGFVAATTALVAHIAGHPFMAIGELRKAVGIITADDISLIEQVASKSKATLRKEIADGIKTGKIPEDLNKYFDIIKRTAGILMKYEVSKAVVNATSGTGQPATTGDQQAPATQ